MQLIILNLSNSGLLTVPLQLLNMRQLKGLSLSQNKLNKLPSDLFLALPKLEELDLSGNLPQKLPLHLGDLKHLTHLDLRSNQLIMQPLEIMQLSTLKYLDISWNHLRTLPHQIYSVQNLNCLLIEPNPFLSSIDKQFLQQLNNCKGERLGMPLIGSKTLRINGHMDKVEAKAKLLMHLIRELATQNPNLRLSEDDLLRYEAEQHIEITYQSVKVKVKVKTSLMRVIILAISLSFFYLYLKFVYPIHGVFLSQ